MAEDIDDVARRKRRNKWLMAGILAWAVWATLPPGEIAFDADCHPQGGPAAVSAFVYGKWFWRRQMEALVAETNRLLALPAQREAQEAEEQRRKVDDRMNHLNKGDARNAAPDERERREEQEQSHRLSRLAWLARCQAEIGTTLGDGQ